MSPGIPDPNIPWSISTNHCVHRLVLLCSPTYFAPPPAQSSSQDAFDLQKLPLVMPPATHRNPLNLFRIDTSSFSRVQRTSLKCSAASTTALRTTSYRLQLS